MDGQHLGEGGLREMFDQLDSQSLGYLVKDDLAVMVDPSQTGGEALDNVMKQLDRDGDGKVTFEDFRECFGQTMGALSVLSPSPRRRQVKPAAVESDGGLSDEDTAAGNTDKSTKHGAALTVPNARPTGGFDQGSASPRPQRLFNGKCSDVSVAKQTTPDQEMGDLETGQLGGGKDEVAPRVVHKYKRFGRRSKPMADLAKADDVDEKMTSPSTDTKDVLTSPGGRGKRQHYLDNFKADEVTDGPASPVLSPTYRNYNPSLSLGNLGLRSIALALDEKTAVTTPGHSQRGPPEHDRDSIFETFGPVSPSAVLGTIADCDNSVLEERVHSLLEDCDIENGQDLRREDLSLVCQHLNVDLPEEQVDELFEQLGENSDGHVSVNDFVSGLSSIYQAEIKLDSPLRKHYKSGTSAPSGLPFTGSGRLSGLHQPGRLTSTPQRPSNTGMRLSAAAPFISRRELFPSLAMSLDMDDNGMVKAEKLFKHWQDMKIDMESEQSVAILFLQSLEMDANERINIREVTSRLEDAITDDDDENSIIGIRFFAINLIYEEIEALRQQIYHANLMKDKLKNDFQRLSDEHRQLINEGDENADSLARTHHTQLRDVEAKYTEKLIQQETEIRSLQESIVSGEDNTKQLIAKAHTDAQKREAELRLQMKEKEQVIEQLEDDVAEARNEIHLWKSHCNKLKEGLDSHRLEALELWERESNDQMLKEQLEMEEAKRLAEQRAKMKELQDMYDEVKAERDTFQRQLQQTRRKSSREKRYSMSKKSRSNSDTSQLHGTRPSIAGLLSPRLTRSNRRGGRQSSLVEMPKSKGELSSSDEEESPLSLSLSDELKNPQPIAMPQDERKKMEDAHQKEIQEQIKHFEEEKLKLERKHADRSKELSAAVEKCDLLLSENARLLEEVAQLRGDHVELSSLQSLLEKTKEEKENIEIERTRLQETLTKSEKETEGLLSYQKQLYADLEKANEEISSAQQNTLELQCQLQSISGERDTLNSELGTIHEEKSALQSCVSNLREGLEEATSRFEATQQTRDLMQKRLEQAEAERQEISVKLKCMEETLANAKGERNSLEERVLHLTDEKSAADRRISELEKSAGDAVMGADEAQEALQSARRHLEELEGEREESANELRAVRETLDAVEKARASLQADHDGMKETCLGLEKRLSTLQQEDQEDRKRLEAKIIDLKADLAERDASNVEAKELLSTYRAKQEKVSERCTELNSQVDQISGEVVALRAQLDEKNVSISALSLEKGALIAKLNQSNTALAEAVDQVEMVVNERDDLAEERDQLFRQLVEARASGSVETEEAVKAARAECDSQWQSQMAQLNAKLERVKQHGESESSRAEEFSAMVANLEKTLAMVSAELDTVKSKQGQDEALSEKLSEQVAAMDRQLVEQTQQLKAAGERELRTLEEKQAAADRLTQLEAEQLRNEENLSILRAELEQERAAAQISAATKAEADEVERLRSQLTAERDELHERERAASYLQSELTELQGALDKQKENLFAEQESLAAEREALHASISQHKHTVQAFSVERASHAGEMAAIEASRAESERKRKAVELELDIAKKTHKREVERLRAVISEEADHLQEEMEKRLLQAGEDKLLHQAEKHRAQIIRLEQQCKVEVERYQHQLRSLEAELVHVRESTEQTESCAVVELRTKLADLHTELHLEQQRNSSLQQQLKRQISDTILHQQSDAEARRSLNVRLQQAMTTVDHVNEENNNLRQNCKHLEETLADTRKSLLELRDSENLRCVALAKQFKEERQTWFTILQQVCAASIDNVRV